MKTATLTFESEGKKAILSYSMEQDEYQVKLDEKPDMSLLDLSICIGMLNEMKDVLIGGIKTI